MAAVHSAHHHQRPRPIDRAYLDYLLGHVAAGEFVPVDPRGPHGNILAHIATRNDRRFRRLLLQEDPLAGVVWVGPQAA